MSVYPRLFAGLIALVLMPGVAFAVQSAIDVSRDRVDVSRDGVDGSLDRGAAPPAIPLARAAKQAPVRLAQVDDTAFRLGQLEERIRVLNGRIEELNFQFLEMQERMRQMQEDNEFRFQELEGSRSDAGGGPPSGDRDTAAIDSMETAPTGDAAVDTLGIIVFDQNGEPVTPPNSAGDDMQTASLPDTGPDALYQASYGHVLAGDYALAEIGFRDYIDTYPDTPLVSDAHFWLGEALYAQGEYHEAAKTLLAAHKLYPNASKSPDMLLKLGMSLAALDNRDTACATYREVLTRYPQAGDGVKRRVAVEQSRMRC